MDTVFRVAEEKGMGGVKEESKTNKHVIYEWVRGGRRVDGAAAEQVLLTR